MHAVPVGQSIRMSQRVQTPPGLLAKQPPAVGGCSTLGQSSVVRHWTMLSAVPPSLDLPDELQAPPAAIRTPATTSPRQIRIGRW